MSLDDHSLNDLVRGTAELMRTLPGPLRRIVVRSGETCVELEWGAASSPNGDPPAAPVVPDETADEAAGEARECIGAPMVGTFYHAPEPGADPFVRPGDVVEPGQQVGILEAMKLMNPIEAETRGRVVDVLVPDGTSVEYGQALISIEPT